MWNTTKYNVCSKYLQSNFEVPGPCIMTLKTLWPDCAYLIFQGPSEPIFVTNNDKLDNWKILQSHHRISNSENVGSELELNSSKLHELNLKSFQNWLFVWLLTIDLINLIYCLAGNKVCLEKKTDNFCVWPFYNHFWPFLCQLPKYLSQNLNYSVILKG